MCVPAGLVDGVPVGMQIIARRHEDALAMQVAARYEQARPWQLLANGYSELRAQMRPWPGGLELRAHPDHRRFVPRPADELHTDRQPELVEAGRH